LGVEKGLGNGQWAMVSAAVAAAWPAPSARQPLAFLAFLLIACEYSLSFYP